MVLILLMCLLSFLLSSLLLVRDFPLLAQGENFCLRRELLCNSGHFRLAELNGVGGLWGRVNEKGVLLLSWSLSPNPASGSGIWAGESEGPGGPSSPFALPLTAARTGKG